MITADVGKRLKAARSCRLLVALWRVIRRDRCRSRAGNDEDGPPTAWSGRRPERRAGVVPSGRGRGRWSRVPPARARTAARRAGTPAPSIWVTSRSTAACPIVSIGCRTVVNGGSVQVMNAESSKPTTDTSAGTERPSRRAARMVPSASTSLAQMMPVTPRSISFVAATRAPSMEKLDRSTHSASPRPSRRPGPSRRACAATARGPPGRAPCRSGRGPSERRCPYACSTATASSVETRGKPSSSTPALTSTTGRPRSVSRR